MIGVGKMNQTCLCGSIDFERVKVERSEGSVYVTAFACCRCGVMYHSPRRPEPPAPPPYKGSLFAPRDPSPHVSTLTPDQERELMEAVSRANKGKHKGLRG